MSALANKTLSNSSTLHSNSIETIIAQRQEQSKGLERLEKNAISINSTERMANIFYCPIRLTDGTPMNLRKDRLFESPM